MNKITTSILFISLIIVAACANQTAPTGGEKDEIPPVLIASTPKQGQLHFKGKEIELTFNELIRTDNPKEQFIITPRIKEEYEIKYRKNKVIIQFEKNLQDSTTYSINFREGIKDLTEGNPADTLKLAFSTGSYLDSLSISGYVYNLLSNQKATDITVALYEADDTLNILNSPPVYFTKTNSDGTYALENLKNGRYRIYAYADKNKNLLLESKSEKHGFQSEIITLDSSISKIHIPIQLLDARELIFQSGRQAGTTYNLKYNKHLTSYLLSSIDTARTIYSNFADAAHNTIQVFQAEDITDSVRVFVRATDSLSNEVTDTIRFKFEPTQRTPSKFESTTLIPKIITKAPLFKAKVKFSKPIVNINYDSIYLYLDTANIIHFTPEQLVWNQSKDEMEITHNIDPSLFVEKAATNTTTTTQNGTTEKQEPKGSVNNEKRSPDKPLNKKTLDRKKLMAPKDTVENLQPTERTDTTLAKDAPTPQQPHFYASPASFISVEQDSSSRIKQNLSFLRPDQLGTLLMDVRTDQPHYVVQLLNTKDEVVAEETNGEQFEFKYVEPGEYRVRILIDSNLNGKWDPGNFNANEEPEPVIFYQNSEGSEKLTLRANWELGPNVIEF